MESDARRLAQHRRVLNDVYLILNEHPVVCVPLQGFSALPSLAFMHIPPEGADGIFNASVCQGPPPREPTSRCPGSETLLETLASIGTLAVFVGHDHDNSWCCPGSQLMLCYGRHTGGYGTLTPGARIIDVRLEGKVTVETRVVE